MARQRWLTCWVPLRLELLISPSWKLKPAPVAKIIDRLCEEHLRHGGQANGKLRVAYEQFVRTGVSRRSIKNALVCAQDLGLIEVIQDQSGEIKGSVRPPNAYRLTFVPVGKAAPSDEWKRVSEKAAAEAVERFRTANNDRSSDQEQEEAANA
ncbi:hypothetical protein ACFFP0_19270 [Rhizobium puerariae]|uniref:Helix-turn-helix domain-containing protein n=1 Tax=Rhizobium puerariae TaxID=1585791 RepID=A0ABV6ALN3_9HYPH